MEVVANSQPPGAASVDVASGENEKGGRLAPSTARLVSLAVLAVVLALLVRGATAVYYAFTDGFVSPTILSPDSDTVIQNKLSLSRLLAERDNLLARMDENQASIAAAESAVAVLKQLEHASSADLGWATQIAGGQAAQSTADLKTLQSERDVLVGTLARQESYLADMQRSLTAGLVHKADVERAQNAVDQARVELLKNEREQLSAETQLRVASLAKAALTSRAERPVATPEMVSLRQALARIHVDVLKAEAERRARAAQQRADQESLARVDELVAQMRKRPIFRAIESSQTVAFVTYDQIRRVRAGGGVYRCSLWGFFGCEQVGAVSEVLPGEVAMQDPWGTAGRGQYAVLSLTDATAAQARSLRVRGAGGAAPGGGAFASR
jgi:hypothetical protein